MFLRSLYVLVGLFLSSDLFAIPLSQLPWKNVVNIQLLAGRTNFINNPVAISRPTTGKYFRLVAPQYCGSPGLNTIGIMDTNNQSPSFTRVGDDATSIYFKFNDNAEHALKIIGMDIMLNVDCDVSVEQASEGAPPDPGGFQPIISDCEAVMRLLRRDYNADILNLALIRQGNDSCAVYIKWKTLNGFKAFIVQQVRSNKDPDAYEIITSPLNQRVSVPLSHDIER